MIKKCYLGVIVDYRYLEAFLAVGRQLNFTRAAQDLGVTQAAVSRQIRLLEHSLGLQLLVRSPQRVVFTPAGERLFRRGSVLDKWVNDDFKAAVPTVRIAVLQGIIENWLLGLIENHFDDHAINFRIETGTQESIDHAIENGDVDIGVNSHNLQTDHLTSFQLFRERIGIVSKNPVNLARVHEYPWVTFDPDAYLVPFARRRSKRIIQVQSNAAVLKLVARGVGITMLPLHLVSDPKSYKIRPIDRFGREYIWATTLNYSQPPEHLARFIQVLRRSARAGAN